MKRTGQSKIAVIGWGRGMGHKGHMYLADAVIQQARDMNADPYFFVSKTVGKDDPIYPEEKVRIYQKVFPQQATIFTPQGNLNTALEELVALGYQGVVVIVGADQKQAFQYLERPNKEGVPVYQSIGLKKLKVISRQETRSQFAREEGPRATPMREILLDPNATEEEKFKVWRRDMPDQLGDNDVLDVMHKAESRLMQLNAPKKAKVKQMSQKVAKLKEAIINLKSKLPDTQQKPKETEPLGYRHLFKTDEPEVPKQAPRFHGWEEYEKEHQPDGQLDEFAPSGDGDNGQEDMFFKYAKLWYNGNEQVQQRIIDILDKAGWEIGEIESEDGGAFIVQAGDEDGGSYMGWSAEELQGLDEGIGRRGILKGLGAAMAAGAAGKASAIAGAFPTPSAQQAMYKAAADSNRAEAKRQAEIKAKQDAERLQKNTELVDKEQRVNHHKLDEFAPGNGDDGLPQAEYQVYQCNPEDQFEWIGGPLYQTDSMGMAHKYAYEQYLKHRPKAFMVWQERTQGSRGNYGVKGQSDEDYLDE